MGQDFGDEIGSGIVRGLSNALTRATERAMYAIAADLAREQRTASSRADGARDGGGSGVPEQVCVPFGTENDAAYFARVCRENGVGADALRDARGLGFLRFAKDDLADVQRCVPQFSEVMTALKNREIAERLDTAEPVTQAALRDLAPIEDLPDLPVGEPSPLDESRGARAEPGREGARNNTERIRDEVRAAREQCRDLDDFERILAGRGIGVTAAKDGELMFYDARRGDDGRLLPYGQDERGRMDWAVSAATLRQERWGRVDATNDWFERNRPRPPMPSEPQVADGSLDADGRTPDLNQGIRSHDGMDTDARTLRIEREQNGTDVAPSEVRGEAERARYSIASKARECKSSSDELSGGGPAPDRDISDKLNPVR